MNDFIDQWYIGLELWYNYSDRYIDAMEVWQSAFQNYYDDYDRCNDTNSSRHRNNIMNTSFGSIDQLESEWKNLIEKSKCSSSSSSITTTSITLPSTSSLSFLQWHIFVAGTCLDAQQYHTARQILYQLIILHLIPSIQQTLHVEPHNETVSFSSSSSPPSLPVLDDFFQLLCKALQEYIATYEEEEITYKQQHVVTEIENVDLKSSSSPWMIGRRIATLRNQLLSSSSSGLSPTPLITPLWNTNNIYQRPPYYLHYPTFFNSSEEMRESMEVYDTPVLPRQYHPVWCQQLENHVNIILEELQQHIDNDNHTLQNHWTPVGASGHRDHNAGIHDGNVVAPGGDWQEIILFSSHTNTTRTNTTRTFPRTKQLIERYCEQDVLTLMETGIGEVILSRMGPQSTHILPHTASHNIRYSAHLPLIVPSLSSSSLSQDLKTTTNTRKNTSTTNSEVVSNCCYIRVGEEKCHWEVGKMLVFDDSYEHEVINSTNEIRIVLLLRFWHPLLQTKSDRHRAMEYIEQAIHTDQLQRYNPPIPCYHRNNVDRNNTDTIRLQRRRMEQSYCPYCQQTGYTSIRFIVATKSFACSCGQDI